MVSRVNETLINITDITSILPDSYIVYISANILHIEIRGIPLPHCSKPCIHNLQKTTNKNCHETGR